MSLSLSVTLRGEAQSKGSWSAFVDRAGRARLRAANPRSVQWQHALAELLLAARPQGWPLDGAYRVEVLILVTRPTSHYGTGRNSGLLKPSAPIHATSGRDVDKCLRLILDSGTGVLWRDDQRVVRAEVERQFTLPGGVPCCCVDVIAEHASKPVAGRPAADVALGPEASPGGRGGAPGAQGSP